MVACLYNVSLLYHHNDVGMLQDKYNQIVHESSSRKKFNNAHAPCGDILLLNLSIPLLWSGGGQ